MDIYNLRQGLKNTMKGSYCEFQHNGKIRFIEVYFTPYDKKMVERLIAIDSLEESSLWKYLKLIKEPIRSTTKYLYQLQTYYGDITQKEKWKFNEKIEQFEQFGFQHIDDLLTFCENQWNISEEDFKQMNDTSLYFLLD